MHTAYWEINLMGNRIGKRRAKSLFVGKNQNKNRMQGLSMEALEERQMLTVTTFQQGVGNYSGQEDTVLYSRDPDVNFGTEGSISPDQQDSNGVRQGLVKFDDIIGSTGNRIPLGAKINSAELVFNVINDSNSAMQMSLYRMQQDWSEGNATWNSFGAIGGVQASEGESSDLPPDGILFDPDTTANSPTAGIFDVARSLEYWVSGSNNFGWMVESAATNGWDFTTKEAPQIERPMLTVDWDVPAGDEFQILTTSFVQAEGDMGETRQAVVEIARLGDLSGPASINYNVGGGTATAGDDYVADSGQVNFATGEAFATLLVTINGDDALEGLETVEVTLSGGTVVAGRDVATITIGDDDALINEVLANISSSTEDETDREYVELIGTPGATLDDYYFAVLEGEEEEGPDGTGAGVAKYVFDLSGQSFGANGLLVIAPTNWEYNAIADADTNVINTASLDGAGGVFEDASQTYMLIRSPNAAITQGTDYDTVGTYENATNQAIGTGVGILDQLPTGADVVDSVGVVEGGGGDRDRVSTTEELGHPGIHVHQPTRLDPNSGNVTSDAVSRREGQLLPNSIGAWFNGDIASGDASSGPIEYENDTFFISVVAPDGSVLTPGSSNTLRTVFFSVADQDISVAEADGSVTLTIERTGDLNEVIDVDYTTVDFGSATEGVDYTGVTDTLTFGVGEAAKDITIPILADGTAEGFERFRVDITGVSAGYLITDGISTTAGAINGEAIVTIEDANVLTQSFQNGTNGYTGTKDAFLDGELIFDKLGQEGVIRVDQVKGEGEQAAAVVRPQQGLIRFDDMFGNGADQIPMGSTIFGGFLTLNVQNPSSGADVRFFQMNQDWEQVNATWLDPQGNAGSSILNGVTPDDVEASATPDMVVPDAGRVGQVEIPLNVDTLQSWANGSSDNFGWSIVSDSGTLWAFNSSEAFLPGTVKPELTILYTAPETVTGAFSLSVDEFVTNEDSDATITINRVGGSTGAATVDWEVTAGTGDLSDLSGSATGSVNFAAGELSKTFTVGINNDSATESNETVNISLSGTGLDFGRDMATLTIRDNDFNPFGGDLFLNELWINSPGNDPPHEFVELVGTPDIPLGSLYYVAIEGLVGDKEGTAEKVVDIGAFQNGAADVDGNGYTLLTPDAADFAFRVPANATQIDGLGPISQENVSTANDSTTYMVLYSPFTSLTTTEFDYDWDNDGALELPLGVQIVDSVGVRVFGALDQLYGPASNQATFGLGDPDVDAVSRDRGSTAANQGSAWFGGDLFPAGDDYLLYESAEAFGLPVTGSALSPGEPNTGDNVASPLVSLVSVAETVAGSTYTVTFNGPVSQFNIGDGGSMSPGGAGITVTDSNGAVVPTVDAIPDVAGLGTDTLTITFNGTGVNGGVAPAGDYLLNFVGNGLIGNARAVDVANDGSEIDGFFQFAFTSPGGGTGGDFNNDGVWDCDDIDTLTAEIASGNNNPAFDLTNDGAVNLADRDAWLAIAGGINLPSGNAYLLGDADLNGAVDGADFIEWNNNKFSTNSAFCSGDFDANGVVDGADFIIWNNNKFQSADGIALINVDQADSLRKDRVEADVAVATEPATDGVALTPYEAKETDSLSLRDRDAEDRELEAVESIFADLSQLI